MGGEIIVYLSNINTRLDSFTRNGRAFSAKIIVYLSNINTRLVGFTRNGCAFSAKDLYLICGNELHYSNRLYCSCIITLESTISLYTLTI